MPDEPIKDMPVAETPEQPVCSLSFDDKVIKKIAGYAINDITGILAISGNFIAGLTDMLRSADDATKGITVETDQRKVAVSLKIICEYGRNIPLIFQEMNHVITRAVKDMTGLDVSKINVHVYDVLTKEDFDKQNKKRSDEKSESIIVAE